MRHLFACTNELASGKPACGKRGGRELVAAVQQELLARRAGDAARVTACSCLGPCFDGPNAVVYPDGVWFGSLDERDASALADYLLGGAVAEPLVKKRCEPPGE